MQNPVFFLKTLLSLILHYIYNFLLFGFIHFRGDCRLCFLPPKQPRLAVCLHPLYLPSRVRTKHLKREIESLALLIVNHQHSAGSVI